MLQKAFRSGVECARLPDRLPEKPKAEQERIIDAAVGVMRSRKSDPVVFSWLERFGLTKEPKKLYVDPNPVFEGEVGFLATAYMEIGGTEVWHQTLISNLDNVAGFVCMEEQFHHGDLTRLPCPAGVGLDAARKLASACKVLVMWGVDARLGEVLEGIERPPRVISVSHCDSRSDWTANRMLGAAPWTDQCVYLCPTGVDTCPDGIPSVQIHNAPNPERVRPTRSRSETRKELGLKEGDRLLLAVSRFSPEKRLDVLVDAVAMLPEEYHLVIAGAASEFMRECEDHLRSRLHTRARIIDPVECPANLLAAADAYLSASEYEGYGLSTAEAMLAGVPVISTPVGLLEEEPTLARLVHHNATAAEWSDAIESDFNHSEWRRARVIEAKRSMQTRHSVERFADSWRRLIAGRIDLSDVTFTIPVRIDTPDRLENVELVLSYLRHHFDTNIMLLEDAPEPRCSQLAKLCDRYLFVRSDSESMHRTRALNTMAGMATTPIVVNYDADVLFPVSQYVESAERIRRGEADMVYPYESRFVRLDRETYYKRTRATLSVEHIDPEGLVCYSPSLGGAVFWNRESFLSAGGENENFRTWGYEDDERFARAKILGLKVDRVPGVLFHMDHEQLDNCKPGHEAYDQNRREFERIKAMTPGELRDEIESWKSERSLLHSGSQPARV